MGKEITFFGINCYGVQRPPFVKERHYYDHVARKIKEWGFNCVRIPLAWDFIEPARNAYAGTQEYKKIMAKNNYPDDYLLRVDWLIDYFGSMGIYAIPELHSRTIISDINTDSPFAELKKERFKGIAPWLKLSEIPVRTPMVLKWLSEHWKGNPNIAAIEVPYNEPNPMAGEEIYWEKDQTYYNFIQACAIAVKQGDSQRLTLMDPPFWALDNTNPASTWRTPPEVDGIFPHYYHGRTIRFHDYIPVTLSAVYGTGPAIYIAPFLSSGKPVLMGEAGSQFFGEKTFCPDMEQARREKSLLFQKSVDSFYSQWIAMGVKGIFYHCTDFFVHPKGLYTNITDQQLNPTSLGKTILKYRDVLAQADGRCQNAQIAIVKAGKRALPNNLEKANVGVEAGLYPIASELLKLNAVPFHVYTLSAVKSNPGLLRKYKVILCDIKILSCDAIDMKVVSDMKIPYMEFKEKIEPEKLKQFLKLHHIKINEKSPANILLSEHANTLIAQEREGHEGEFTIYPVYPEDKHLEIIDKDKNIIFRGTGKDLLEKGLNDGFSAYSANTYIVKQKH